MLSRAMAEPSHVRTIKAEHLDMLYNLLVSHDAVIRKLALIILLYALCDPDVFAVFMDIMCLGAVPGLVVINPHSVKKSRSQSFQKYLLQNRDALKNNIYAVVLFDAITGNLEPLYTHEFYNYLNLDTIRSMIDPLEVPVLVNFQPPNMKTQNKQWRDRQSVLYTKKTQIKNFDPHNFGNDTSNVYENGTTSPKRVLLAPVANQRRNFFR